MPNTKASRMPPLFFNAQSEPCQSAPNRIPHGTWLGRRVPVELKVVLVPRQQQFHQLPPEFLL
jgi:hypothetical protein